MSQLFFQVRRKNMKGDFSRDSFDRFKHFRRVLMQQGRVQLDADWNEQVSILLHYIQTLAADIIGPYAGPEGDNFGFAIKANSKKADFSIGKGRYYVNGILCENDAECSYLHQPNLPSLSAPELKSGKSYVVYLDVWERHITFLEDDDIREKALGGADTATRGKTVWQVKVKELAVTNPTCLNGAGLLEKEMVLSTACLRASAKRDQEKWEPCLVEPEARYRGPENQLYRVEVHEGGSIKPQSKVHADCNPSGHQPVHEDGSMEQQPKPTPTFKWSRENGSVAFPIKKKIMSNENDTVTFELENLGRDDRFGLAVNDLVEFENDDSVNMNEAKSLLQVQKVDCFEMTVTLKRTVDIPSALGTHALLRRWDQKKSATDVVIPIVESSNDDNGWLELEDGIKIQFKPGGIYRTGDYWLIPARTALGDVEWDEDKFMPPRGVMHHLAPLAIVSVEENGSVTLKNDCRCTFSSLPDNCTYGQYRQLGIGADQLCPERIEKA
jgi:hypothetical protein